MRRWLAVGHRGDGRGRPGLADGAVRLVSSAAPPCVPSLPWPVRCCFAAPASAVFWHAAVRPPPAHHLPKSMSWRPTSDANILTIDPPDTASVKLPLLATASAEACRDENARQQYRSGQGAGQRHASARWRWQEHAAYKECGAPTPAPVCAGPLAARLCDEVSQAGGGGAVAVMDQDGHIKVARWVGKVERGDVDAGTLGLGHWGHQAAGHVVAAHRGGDAVRPPAGRASAEVPGCAGYLASGK